MADNVPITAGSGTTVATDDVAGVHYQYVKLVDGTAEGTGKLGGDATNGLDVDVTRVGGDVSVIGKAADGAAVAGNPVLIAGQDGTNAQSIKTDANGELQVDVLTLPAVVAAGDVAHDGVNSGNPLQVGVEAIAHGTNPTAVAAADRTKLYANRAGIQFVIGGHPAVLTLKHTTITTAVTDAAIVTIAGGLKIVVTAFTVTLDNASTVFPTFLMGFGATTTPTTTGVLGAHGGVPAGGGFNRGDGSGILGVGADGEDLRVTTTGNATGNGLQIVVTYYTIES